MCRSSDVSQTVSLSQLAYDLNRIVLLDSTQPPAEDADPNDLRVFLELEALLVLQLTQRNRGPRETLIQQLQAIVSGVDWAGISTSTREQLAQQAEIAIRVYGKEILPIQRQPLLAGMTDIAERTRRVVSEEIVRKQAESVSILHSPHWPSSQSGGETISPPQVSQARALRDPLPAAPAAPPVKPPIPEPLPVAPAPQMRVYTTQTTNWNKLTTRWTPKDARAMDYLAHSQALYAGKYVEEGMVKRARLILTRDYSLYGDRPDRIAQRVKDGLVSMTKVTDQYWQTVAVNALNNARTYANLSTMIDGGVSYYQFVAVMDERTTAICRSLDGKTWSVRPSLDRMERAMTARDLAELDRWTPMIRNTVNDDGEITGFEFGPAENPTTFNGDADLAWLAENGVCIPPLHFYCRSTIKPA